MILCCRQSPFDLKIKGQTVTGHCNLIMWTRRVFLQTGFADSDSLTVGTLKAAGPGSPARTRMTMIMIAARRRPRLPRAFVVIKFGAAAAGGCPLGVARVLANHPGCFRLPTETCSGGPRLAAQAPFLNFRRRTTAGCKPSPPKLRHGSVCTLQAAAPCRRSHARATGSIRLIV